MSRAGLLSFSQEIRAGSTAGSGSCRYISSAQVSEQSNVSSPQTFSITILCDPLPRPTRDCHRRWRWWCARLRSRTTASEKRDGREGHARSSYRLAFTALPELLLARASRSAQSATLTLLTLLDCASLARHQGTKKRERHQELGGTSVLAVRYTNRMIRYPD